MDVEKETVGPGYASHLHNTINAYDYNNIVKQSLEGAFCVLKKWFRCGVDGTAPNTK